MREPATGHGMRYLPSEGAVRLAGLGRDLLPRIVTVQAFVRTAKTDKCIAAFSSWQGPKQSLQASQLRPKLPRHR